MCGSGGVGAVSRGEVFAGVLGQGLHCFFRLHRGFQRLGAQVLRGDSLKD